MNTFFILLNKNIRLIKRCIKVKFKKLASILSLVLMMSSTNVFASSIDTNHIPKSMDPGTTITFDENKEIIIINEGEKTQFSENFISDIEESTLPLAEEGMIVTYDALGQPIVVNQNINDENKINIDVKKIENSTEPDRNIDARATENYQTGNVTYYYASGKVGNSGEVLDEWSAAHMYLPYWTQVHVYDLENKLQGTNVWVLDRGNFSSGVVLDIDSQRFKTSFYPLSKGMFKSKIVWYTN